MMNPMKNKAPYNSCVAHSLLPMAHGPWSMVYGLFFLLLLASCTDNDILTDTAVDTTSTTTGSLRFTLNQASTRLTYDDLSTYFEDGDSIGCVLATSTTDDDGNTSYSFLANSKWTVGKATDESGTTTYSLMVSQIYTGTTADDGNSVTYTAYDPLTDTSSLLSTDSDGYLSVNYSDGPVFFFFYYPFVSVPVTSGETTTTADLTNVPYLDTTSDGSTTRTYLMGPAYNSTIVNTSSTTTTETDDDGNSVTYSPQTTDAACFTAFPAFVHTDQSTVTCHNYGDFLWASYTNSDSGVTSDNIGDLGDQTITFAKKTATLRVRSDKQLYDVHIRPWTTTTTQTPQNIVIGQQIDLTTGTLTAYSGTTSDSSIPQESLYLLPTGTSPDEATRLYPYDNSAAYSSDDEYPYEYRFVLPAQSSFDGTLYFYTSDPDESSDLEYTTQALTDFNGELTGGKAYNINYQKSPPITIYFTAGTSSNNYTDGAAVVSDESINYSLEYSSNTPSYRTSDDRGFTLTGVVSGKTSFNDYLYVQSGIYVNITLTSQKKITVYLGKNSAASGFYIYQLQDGSRSNTYRTEYSLQSDDNVGNYITSETLNAGSYQLGRKSGNTYIFLIVIENP